MSYFRRSSWLVACLGLVCACDNGDGEDDVWGGSDAGSEPSGSGSGAEDDSGGDDDHRRGFSRHIVPIFERACVVGCHEPGGSHETLLLTPDGAYSSLVGVPSEQMNGAMVYVARGDVRSSYLWHKIDGSFGDVGGAGGPMPLEQGPLPAAELLTIRAWIADGAHND